jgi:adenylate kinase
MKLIVLHGLPGVGKLTVARELAQQTGFKVFHNHLTVDLLLSVFEFGSPSFVELREKIWLDVLSGAASENVSGLIFTFVFERTVRDDFIQRLRNVIEACGSEVLFVNLVCSRTELEKRMTDPSRQAFGKLNSLVEFDSLSRSGALSHPEVPKDGIEIDTTALSPSATASRIVNELGLGKRS